MPDTKLLDFTKLSAKNRVYETQEVRVMNGTVFRVLQLTPQEASKLRNVIYLHINRSNLKCYVGITIMSPQSRWGSGSGYRNNRRFGHAIRKYGWDSFDSHIIAIADSREDLNDAEIQAIAAAGGHKSKFTYNLSPGGDTVADNGKPIVGINLQSGENYTFKSSSEAARELGLNNSDMPSSVARGEIRATGDWWFRFEDDLDAKPPTIWGEKARIAAVRALQGKRVIAINLKTGEQHLFATTNEAGEVLGMNQSAVSMVARGEIKSAKNWWFKFEGDSAEPPTLYGTALTRSLRDKKVYAINLETGDRKEFRNCTAADQELRIYKGAAAMVCSGERTSAAGWWFSYHKDVDPPKEYKGALVAKARSKAIIAIELSSGKQQHFLSAKDASDVLGMSRSMISMILSGKRTSAKGYTFGFDDADKITKGCEAH